MRLKKKYKIFGLSQKLNRSNSIGNPLIPTKIQVEHLDYSRAQRPAAQHAQRAQPILYCARR